MAMLFKTLIAVAAGTLFAMGATAQNASVPSTLIPTENEPPPTLAVTSPLPEPLARGAVLIPYRVENIRILPVLGMEATKVSPRAGHLHVTVDDTPWHWGDFASSNTIVIVGMPPGEHKVMVELADPTHRIITGQTVTFRVPEPAK
ncbi:MAG TPA: DUF6130 family protein [Acetobacteraceae bacterium]|nr:DUF6130 family protein [Acetobacteraceae bacterium]